MTELEIADRLHDALLREIARMAPAGGARALPTNTLTDALLTLLAEILIATQPALPAEEIERLAALFKVRLEQEFAERAGAVGHA